MQNNQTFGLCTLRDGGYGGTVRWILHIPIHLYTNLKVQVGDRGKTDVIVRLFASLHRGGWPMWHERYEETYAVEFPDYDTDATVESFVALILENQEAPKVTTPPVIPAPKPPPEAKRSWWKWILRIGP